MRPSTLSVKGFIERLTIYRAFNNSPETQEQRILEPYAKAENELRKNIIKTFLGINPLTGREAQSALQSINHPKDSRSFIYRDNEGQIGVITACAVKTDGVVAKMRGEQLVRNALAKTDFPDEGQPLLPAHIRTILKQTEVTPEAAEYIVRVAGEITVTGKLGRIKISSSYPQWNGNERKWLKPEDWFERYNAKIWRETSIQISKEPVVKVTKTGVTANISLPRTVGSNLKGKKISDIIRIPGLPDGLILSATIREKAITMRTKFEGLPS